MYHMLICIWLCICSYIYLYDRLSIRMIGPLVLWCNSFFRLAVIKFYTIWLVPLRCICQFHFSFKLHYINLTLVSQLFATTIFCTSFFCTKYNNNITCYKNNGKRYFSTLQNVIKVSVKQVMQKWGVIKRDR